MANVNLKKDFVNGEKLYDYHLNNNFSAIEAALSAMNKIVWQDDEENGASISAYKGDTDAIEDRELIDGQLLYNTETGETYIDTYIDDVLTRINTGSGNVVAIQDTEPENDAVKLWIETDIVNNNMKYRDPSTGTFTELVVKASDTLSIGSIVEWTTETAPDGWLICDGSAVSRTTYALLFAVIGTTYGEGDGETTFNIPEIEGTTSIIKATQIIAPPANKNIITAYMNQTEATGTTFDLATTGYSTIPLDASISVGDKLTISDNGVKIGSDVHHVRISSQLSFNSLTAGTKFVTIYKNNSILTVSAANLSARDMLNNTECLIDVAENDIITLRVSGTQGDAIRRLLYTFITIEVVD